jgi:MFS transporter, DHA1 family, multidrug resistance protein
MLLMDKSKDTGISAVAFASTVLAFASLGDAFLYAFLPVNNSLVGVPVVWIGVLLSINRFVRIISNGFMVHVFARYGLRIVMIGAVVLAILSTGGYAIATGVFAWLIFRICWGLAFSAMRIGGLGYALQSSRQGIALGISRSLQEAGPMLALFFAPFLLKVFNPQQTFIALAIFSSPGIYFALKLPRIQDTTQALGTKRLLPFPSVFNSITLVSAILIDGILMVVLGILFMRYNSDVSLTAATTLAAIYLGYRRLCLVVLSPAGGWLADKFGLEKIFTVSLVLVIAGLFVLVSGNIAVGAVMVFTFYSVNAAISPGTVSKNHPHSLAAVAGNATWRDIGAALGTLVGGLLITSPHLSTILLIFIFGLMILLLVHLRTAEKALKVLYLWK